MTEEIYRCVRRARSVAEMPWPYSTIERQIHKARSPKWCMACKIMINKGTEYVSLYAGLNYHYFHLSCEPSRDEVELTTLKSCKRLCGVQLPIQEKLL